METDSAENDRSERILPHEVRRNFSRAARSYESNAEAQEFSAEILSEEIKRRFLGRPHPKLVCEAGCGTGKLTRRLLKLFPKSSFLVSDISEQMLEVCSESTRQIADKFGIDIRFERNNFNLPMSLAGVDLFASSMSLQWSDSPLRTVCEIRKSLPSNALLAFSVPGNQSFSHVRRAFEESGLRYPFENFCEADKLRAALSEYGTPLVWTESAGADFASAISFFRHLKAIGAVNASGRAMSVPDLRRIMKSIDSGEKNAIRAGKKLHVEYEIIFCVL